MPAQSPTLSPTLSAIVAGLRGSSSGMPASTLPTRSAPTSAALVKMPPPTRRNRASSEPPNPKPTRIAELRVLEEDDDERGAEQAEADGEHAGDAAGAERHRERVGHAAGQRRGGGADVAARGERHADVAGEARRRGSRGRRRPCARVPTGRRSAPPSPSGLTISVDVKNTISGDRDEDHGDRAELALEVGQGTLLDRQGDLAHLRACPRRRRAPPGRGRSRRRWPAGRPRPTATGRSTRRPCSTKSCQPPSAPSSERSTCLRLWRGSVDAALGVPGRLRGHSGRSEGGADDTGHQAVATADNLARPSCRGGAASSGLSSSSSRWAVSGYQRSTMTTTSDLGAWRAAPSPGRGTSPGRAACPSRAARRCRRAAPMP